MRAHAAVAVLGMTGALLAGSVAEASAAPASLCGDAALGAAGAYAEFVEGDSVRFADSEGAVAVGGDARFGDPKTGQGFSIGAKLTGADLGKLPGKHSMLVGGTLRANQVVLSKGSGLYAGLEKTGEQFAVDGEHAAGSSPLDFGAEFEKLRSRSAGWGAAQGKGSVQRTADAGTLTLTGEDKQLNVFAVNAADLQKAASVAIKVPTGATTLVNVIGAGYDSSKLYGIYLWDAQSGSYVLDDYQAGSAQFKAVRSKLLWNFPTATSVVKNHASWPGTILAPRAHVELGRGSGAGSVAPGHVNGSVIAKRLSSVPGAETHQMTFSGCLPAAADPGKPDPSVPPVPECDEIVSTPPALPKPPDPIAPADPGKPSASASPSKKPSDSSTSGAVAPVDSPSADPGVTGDLAATGGGVPPGFIAAGLAAVASGAALVAVTRRRRRAHAGG